MKYYGLLGRNIDYSFSRTYFSEKFHQQNIDAKYKNFDLEKIEEFPETLKNEAPINGLNVTIPYKQEVIPFLQGLDEDANKIGAVNTIKFEEDGRLTGYNTDFYGFGESLKPLLEKQHSAALILGTGGASKAVAYALQKLGIAFKYVSRSPAKDQLAYRELSEEIFAEHQIIINTSPLGTFPNTENCPDLPYKYFTGNHLAYDLIYNPSNTKFMRMAGKEGAKTTNGLKMLQLQAEKAWEIWNK